MQLRIGSVPHLNVRPLIYGIESEITFCTPAQLADAMHQRQFDVGLLPTAEVLLHDQYDIINGICVASHGPVHSVFLIHHRPLQQLRSVAVDPASRSSVWLLRVLLSERYGVDPAFYPRPAAADAALIFGDEAIERFAQMPDEIRLDLGKAWSEWTGLPFVYAVWAAQRGMANGELVAKLHRAKTEGLRHLDEIIRSRPEATSEIRRDYLCNRIRYDLGAPEKAGLRKFQDYLVKLKLVQPHELRFIG
ncbi:MAG: menaquinone biosynthesis protein [Verrucomicrobiae bacterium]|nr:menaquinone biosynthesis protein [Verrucomicrobiae bacterium]